jgi:hypothetical protein
MTLSFPWRAILLPVIVAISSYVLFRLFSVQPPYSFDFDFGFDVAKVMDVNVATASRSWELGVAAEALLELHNPNLTVFTRTPFPGGRLPQSHDMTTVQALKYVRPAIWTNDSAMLTEGEGGWAFPFNSDFSSVWLATFSPCDFVCDDS